MIEEKMSRQISEKGIDHMARISKAPEERREEIINAALVLFQEKGYEKTSIQDIADYMNVATGLCYRYFKSKQEIFAAASDKYAASFFEHLLKPVPENMGVIEKFNLSIRRIVEYGVKHEEFESAFKKEPEISYARLNSVIEKFIEIMIPIVSQGVEEGIFHCEDTQLSVRFLAYGFANVIHAQMPDKNTDQHIKSHISGLMEICKRVLQTDEKSELGQGWENI